MNLNLNKFKILTMLIAGLFSVQLMGQSKVSGNVTDGQEPLIGATVLVKGSSTGVVTDFNGDFTIDANQGDVLTISYTGFTAIDVTITDAASKMNVVLQSGIGLDEVVVTGYSVDSRRKTPGSVIYGYRKRLAGIPFRKRRTAIARKSCRGHGHL